MDETFEGKKCGAKIRDQLNKMVDISRGWCMITPRRFFTHFFGRYKDVAMRYRASEPFDPSERPFLESECSMMDKMFRKICSRFENEHPPVLTNIGNLENIDDIHANNILFIRCPTIFAGYHYIFAVVDENGRKVDVYQEYGTIPLFRIRGMDIKVFKFYLTVLKNIKTIPLEQAVKFMTEIEEKLYRTDVNGKFEKYIEQIARNIEEGLLEEDEDEDVTDPTTFEQFILFFFKMNVINTNAELSVEVLRFNHSNCPQTAGKTRIRKHKKRKGKTRKHIK